MKISSCKENVVFYGLIYLLQVLEEIFAQLEQVPQEEEFADPDILEECEATVPPLPTHNKVLHMLYFPLFKCVFENI